MKTTVFLLSKLKGLDMKKIVWLFAPAALVVMFLSINIEPPLQRTSCTGISVTKNGVALFGNNEDYYPSYDYKIWFLPAGNGKYGTVYWGHNNTYAQGGMNDQGLCFDGYGTPRINLEFPSDKIPFNGNLTDKIMRECATVDEAIELINIYRYDVLRNVGQLMFADKTGKSMIVGGWNSTHDDIAIIQKTKTYQIVTNYFLLSPSLGGYPCWRYDTAKRMLEQNDDATIENVRSILDAVHIRENGQQCTTLYSFICDLQNLDIYFYYFHDFEKVVKFNLVEELQKGNRYFSISSMFTNSDQDQNPDNNYDHSEGNTGGKGGCGFGTGTMCIGTAGLFLCFFFRGK
ncbi:carcinine hydrolase/isopenicillin-N N-acyltransferase family protein [candidate division KSB1 bacterium]